MALFVLDLDRFKEVNDTLGHHTGDRLLQIVAQRLREAVRPEDTVARLGGDEFAVLLPRVRDEEAALEVARRIGVALAEPFQLEGMLLELEASVGVALAPSTAPTSSSCMRCADIAMYVAKDERTGVEIYAASRDRHSPNRLGAARVAAQGHRATASSSCTTSPRSRSRPARSPASRPSCAGGTRSAAWSCPTSSSRWPSTRV